MIIKIRHLGIIVNDIDESVAMYKALLGLKDEEITFVPPRGTETDTVFAFIQIGDIELELIQPISEKFKNLLGNPKAGINHIAFVVRDLDEAIHKMAEKGIRLGHVTKDGIIDMQRSRVAYFDPQDTGGMLIEFVEPKE